MRRLSARTTFFTKRVFPAFWFGVVAIVFAGGVAAARSGRTPPPPVLIVPVVMAVVGWVIMKHLVFDLVDEVWDAGNELVVRNGGREARVPLRDVMNVGYTVAMNPQRVTLMLRQPSIFGREITFAAPRTWNPFARHPLIEELVERIDAARGLDPARA